MLEKSAEYFVRGFFIDKKIKTVIIKIMATEEIMVKSTQYFKKHRKNIRRALLAGGIVGILSGGCFYKSNSSEVKLVPEKNKTEEILPKLPHLQIKNPLTVVYFRNDTLDKSYGGGLLYYQNSSITRNYVENNEKYKLQLYLVTHEWWHSQNDLLKFRSGYLLSPYEFYRLCIYNEISATLASLLVKRYEYLAADNKKNFLSQHKYGYFSFYFNAIAQGKINPEDSSPLARNKEWKLIANGMKKVWMERFAEHYYPSFHAMLRSYCDKKVNLLWKQKNTHSTYLRLCHKMFNIGGVDFYNYMENDVDFQSDQLWITENIRKIKSMHGGSKKMLELLDAQIKLLSKISPEKQNEALQHLLISAQLKEILGKINKQKLEEQPNIIGLTYHKILNQMQRDQTFKSVVKSFMNVSSERCNLLANETDYENVLKELYTFRGNDLRTFIPNFVAAKVPVRSMINQDIKEYLTTNSFISDNSDIFSVYTETADEEKSLALLPKFLEKASLPSQSLPIRQRKKHLSTLLHVIVPNFSQPILLADDRVQNEIFAAIRAFDKIPDVYKNCDTKAQQQYQKTHPTETNPFMQNFQQTRTK